MIRMLCGDIRRSTPIYAEYQPIIAKAPMR